MTYEVIYIGDALSLTIATDLKMLHRLSFEGTMISFHIIFMIHFPKYKSYVFATNWMA